MRLGTHWGLNLHTSTIVGEVSKCVSVINSAHRSPGSLLLCISVEYQAQQILTQTLKQQVTYCKRPVLHFQLLLQPVGPSKIHNKHLNTGSCCITTKMTVNMSMWFHTIKLKGMQILANTKKFHYTLMKNYFLVSGFQSI